MRTLSSNHSWHAPLVAACMVGLLVFAIACERSPEDLEEWRNAQDGMTQIAQWVESDDEPDDVRKRGAQILVEAGQSARLSRTLDEIEDDQMRDRIAGATMPTIEEMWEQQDFPELTEEMQEEGAQIAVEESEAVDAVDAIYNLIEYYDGDTQQQAQQILRDWISDDQQLRTQLADTGVPYLVEPAGEDAIELIRDWILETHEPRELTSTLRRHGPEDGLSTVDEVVAERAEKAHPDIDEPLQHAVAGAETDAIVPYLEMAIEDEATDDQFRQVAIDTAAKVGGEGVELLTDVVENETGPMRWAAANAIIDARGTAGLVDVAGALPEETDDYETPDDDSFHRYVSQLCNYIDSQIQRDNIDGEPEPVGQLLEMDHWAGQTIGLQCAGALEFSDFRDEIQALEDETFDIPAWGERQTVGDFAATIDTVLAEAEGEGDEEEG